jgi:hypothetical protein
MMNSKFVVHNKNRYFLPPLFVCFFLSNLLNIDNKNTLNALADMRVSAATGKPLSGSSIGCSVNSLHLTRSGQ